MGYPSPLLVPELPLVFEQVKLTGYVPVAYAFGSTTDVGTDWTKMRLLAGTGRVWPAGLPSVPVAAYPGVPQFVVRLIPGPVGGFPTTFVALVHGLLTVIVPSELKTMLVGPVYRHPGRATVAGRSVLVSCFSWVFVAGMATTGL
jgi:hypothetical protein